MSGDVEKIAAAIGEAIGMRLDVTSSREWASVTFSGWRIVFRPDADLSPNPAYFDRLAPTMPPGFELVDLMALSPRELEALVVRTHKGDPM